jgi:iron-sulfur cluster assembly protein
MIHLTPPAAEFIRAAMLHDNVDPEETALRLYVSTGGCAGFSFNLEFDDRQRKFDVMFESNGIHILVDKKSLLVTKGTTISYSSKLSDHGLTFENPQATGSCSCKTSFTIPMTQEEDVFKPTW